jgi:hypothetical protein
VSHKWGYYEPVTDKPVTAVLPEKRARVQRNTNGDYLGRAHTATVVDVEDVEDDEDDGDPDGDGEQPLGESDQETAPESFEEAVQQAAWVQSMTDEVNALKNRGVWRVVPTPGGEAYRIEVRLSCQEGLDRPRRQEEVATSSARILAAGRN